MIELKCLSKRYNYIPVLTKTSGNVCHMAKKRKFPYAPSNSNAKCVFDLINAHIWGYFSTTYVHGFKYFLNIVGDHSRYLWVIIIKNKGEIYGCLKGFFCMVKT